MANEVSENSESIASSVLVLYMVFGEEPLLFWEKLLAEGSLD